MKSANVVLAPCASSCRTERVPRNLFFRPYSGEAWPVDRNLMLDRLTDNLDIQRNTLGSGGAARTRKRPCAGATGSESWQRKQSALSERAAWAGQWPGAC